ncbi:hypothetical protein EMIT0P44_130054 [Pseudomonas sp. IT-P44]
MPLLTGSRPSPGWTGWWCLRKARLPRRGPMLSCWRMAGCMRGCGSIRLGGLLGSIDWGHIRCCGNGFYWFRPYGESLWKSPKVTKALLPLSFGASLWLGMPSLRSCSVGPPPSAIPGRGRLTRHPCRVAHCAEPPLGLSRGRVPQDQKRKAS